MNHSPLFSRLRPLFLVLFLSGFSVFAQASEETITLTEKAPVYSRAGGKLQRLGIFEAGQKFTFRRILSNGKWAEVTHNGQPAYVRAKSTNNQDSARNLSSTAAASPAASRASVKKSPVAYKAGTELLFGTSGMGIGLGLRFTAELPFWRAAKNRTEVMGTFSYFPSVAGAGSSTLFGALGRYSYRLRNGFDVGPEAGLTYMISSVSTPTFPGVVASASSLGISLGGFAEGTLSERFGWISGLRFVIHTGSVALFYGGLQYHF